MSSTCIYRCIDDARPPVMVVRATFRNLYKWPESDAEFLRSVSSNRHRDPQAALETRPHHHPRGRVVDSISCRQLYLKSYTFSRDDDGQHHGTTANSNSKGSRSTDTTNRSRAIARKRRSRRSRTVAALRSVFRQLLSCTAKVDVVG